MMVTGESELILMSVFLIQNLNRIDYAIMTLNKNKN